MGKRTPAEVVGLACCPPLTGTALSESDSVDLARVFAALSDPVRLRLYSLIAAAGEACSCHVEETLGRSQPTISHHTRILAEAGLIVGDKRGRWMWWSIAPERLDLVVRLLGGHQSLTPSVR
jgi:ArsR family transcriptional regulator, arsenate/arsenite/antimonite-responsive transcriptional repressor